MTDHKNIIMKDSIESFGRRPVIGSKNTSIEMNEQFVDQRLYENVENIAEKPPLDKDQALIKSVQKILDDIKA